MMEVLNFGGARSGGTGGECAGGGVAGAKGVCYGGAESG